MREDVWGKKNNKIHALYGFTGTHAALLCHRPHLLHTSPFVSSFQFVNNLFYKEEINYQMM